MTTCSPCVKLMPRRLRPRAADARSPSNRLLLGSSGRAAPPPPRGERVGQPLEPTPPHRAVIRPLAPVAPAPDEPQELLALEPQRLVGGDLRDIDVAAP